MALCFGWFGWVWFGLLDVGVRMVGDFGKRRLNPIFLFFSFLWGLSVVTDRRTDRDR